MASLGLVLLTGDAPRELRASFLRCGSMPGSCSWDAQSGFVVTPLRASRPRGNILALQVCRRRSPDGIASGPKFLLESLNSRRLSSPAAAPSGPVRLRAGEQRHRQPRHDVCPLGGWRHVKVTDRHTALDYAHVLKDLADVHFANAKTIVLIQDNFNIHSKASHYEAFPAVEARRLVPSAIPMGQDLTYPDMVADLRDGGRTER
jgi:hypothetical protein